MVIDLCEPKLTLYHLRVPMMPKKKCCSDKPRCQRCPLRALAEGTLPEGYTVKKRRLVKIKDLPSKKTKKRPVPVAA